MSAEDATAKKKKLAEQVNQFAALVNELDLVDVIRRDARADINVKFKKF